MDGPKGCDVSSTYNLGLSPLTPTTPVGNVCRMVHPTITAEQRLRATPVHMKPLAFYQQPLPCSDRPRALTLARQYERANQAWRDAVRAETVPLLDEKPRLAAHADRVAALDELRELGGLPLVDFVCHAGRHCRDLEAARADGTLGRYHISWAILAGQYAALSLNTFGEVFWQDPC